MTASCRAEEPHVCEMPRPKNGNKNTHVCVGGVRGRVCSPLGAGRGRGHQAETPPAWAPPPAPCPQPWGGGHCSQGTQSWKCPTRPLVALRWPSAPGRVHKRGQKSASSAADPSPSRSGAGPVITEAVAQCRTPRDQRPRRGSATVPAVASTASACPPPLRGRPPGPAHLRMPPQL